MLPTEKSPAVSEPMCVLPDRWLVWPVMAAVITATVVSFFCDLPGWGSLLLIPITFLSMPVVGACMVIAVCVLGAMRRPRKAASVGVALLMPPLLWLPIQWVTLWLHVGLTVWLGLGQIGAPLRPGGETFTAYDWSVGLAGGPNTFLIHDMTDAIVLPRARGRGPANDQSGLGEACAGQVTRVLPHYFICSF